MLTKNKTKEILRSFLPNAKDEELEQAAHKIDDEINKDNKRTQSQQPKLITNDNDN